MSAAAPCPCCGAARRNLQREGALLPTALGHGSLSGVSVFHNFTSISTAPAGAFLPAGRGRGTALVVAARAADAESAGLLLSADGGRPCIHISARPSPHELAELRALAAAGTAQMSRFMWRDTASDAHLASALCALTFAGCGLEPPVHTLHGGLRAFCVSALARALRFEDVGAGARPELRVQLRVYSHGRRVWKSTGTPDFLLVPRDAAHADLELDELYWGACCALFERSAQQGRTVDARAAVLQALLTGLILEMAREAQRRECIVGGTPFPPGLLRCQL